MSAEMEFIRVNAWPPDANGTVVIPTQASFSAEKVVEIAVRLFGDGNLVDAKGCWVRPDPARQLCAGDYLFIKRAQGWAVPEKRTPAFTIATAPQAFTTTPTWMYDREDSGPGSKAFPDVSEEEAYAVAHFFGFSVCNGHKLQRLDPPPPGTAECGSFPLGKFPDTDAASADLAALHQRNLEKMKVPMGGKALRVLDVHSRKKLLALCAGADKQWYIGGIDCAVVPCDEADRCAAQHIRVGFVHLQEDEQDCSAPAQSSQMQADTIDGAVTAPLEGALPQMLMTTLAAVAMNAAPLDLVATDGTHFTLYRTRNRDILVYQCLTATEAYHALAVALEQNGLARSVPKDDLPKLPTSTTKPHHMLAQKLEKHCGVDAAELQNHTDIVASPTSSLEGGTFL